MRTQGMSSLSHFLPSGNGLCHLDPDKLFEESEILSGSCPETWLQNPQTGICRPLVPRSASLTTLVAARKKDHHAVLCKWARVHFCIPKGSFSSRTYRNMGRASLMYVLACFGRSGSSRNSAYAVTFKAAKTQLLSDSELDAPCVPVM